MTQRRELLALGGGLLAAGTLPAQSWREGVHYQRINPPVASPLPGRVEVVEFFWYGCPLCNAFEPALLAWTQRLPSWVAFRKQHLFLREATRPHQRLFYTLDAMGVESRFRPAIFAAMHERRLPLDTPKAMIELLKPLGLDVARFESTWKAFEPKAFSAARIENANRQAGQAYKVNGVPTLAIGGRFLISPPEASERRAETPVGASALRLADHLLSTLKPA